MNAPEISETKNTGVFLPFYFVPFICAVPPLFLAAFIIDSAGNNTMRFWIFFLVSLVPCGLLAVLLCAVGLYLGFKRKSRLNKILGFIGLFIGAGVILAGILAIGLIYVVVGK